MKNLKKTYYRINLYYFLKYFKKGDGKIETKKNHFDGKSIPA